MLSNGNVETKFALSSYLENTSEKSDPELVKLLYR